MASRNLVFLLFSQLYIFFILTSAQPSSLINPFKCSHHIKTCDSLLYQHNQIPETKIATLYSVNTSSIIPIMYSGRQDYLISVPCSCENVNGTIGYFYDTVYKVHTNDTFFDVSINLYSGSVWKVGGEEKSYLPGVDVEMHLLCGCVENATQIVVTYTVQVGDNLSTIANLLAANVNEILKLNPYLGSSPEFLIVGSLLYVPMNLEFIL